MSLISRSATPTTPFGGFGSREPVPDGSAQLFHHTGRIATMILALLPHRIVLPNFWRLLIDAHRSDVNRSHLTALTVFG